MNNLLSANIARYRKERKFTQETLANKLNITFQAVSKWETGQSMPDIATLPKLAAVLGVSVDKLLGYAAYNNESYYEKVYKSTLKSGEYYWGVKPSFMCLKLLELMPPDKPTKVLDIGCGEGKNAVFLARCGYDVSAFDVSDTGIEKTKRLAEKASVHVNVFKADLCDYRLGGGFDVLFSSGVLGYVKPELRDEIYENYRNHTNDNGLNVFNVFVNKPFISRTHHEPREEYFLQSGQLLTYYHDWLIEDFSEVVFNCNSGGIPHKHAMNVLYARKVGG